MRSIIAVAGVVVAGLGAVLGFASDLETAHRPRGSAMIRIVRGRAVVSVSASTALSRRSSARAPAWSVELRKPRRIHVGAATVTLKTDFRALRHAVRDAAAGGGGRTVRAPERPVASSTRLPVVRQALRNNCETAALSMLLIARGARVGQLRLQRELPASGLLDPERRGGESLWGDPSRGFVGRPNGGGAAGGYGVYEQPISALARRHGVALHDLTGSRTSDLYRTLLTGRPVMVWVALSDGPYSTWRTPGGRRVIGNFGEHTVVLTGLSRDSVELNDPLTGTRQVWSKAIFAKRWVGLGRRALGA